MEKQDVEGAMSMGILFSMLMGTFLTIEYRDSKKSPRYDQKEKFGINNRTPLADIAKLIREVFPDVPDEKIAIAGDGIKQDRLLFFISSDEIHFGDSLGSKLYPYCSLSQAKRRAELKDPGLKKNKALLVPWGALYVN